MRILAVDLGKKRIGLAVGDAEHKIAQPLKAIQALGSLKKDASQVADQAAIHEANTIIVGLPLVNGQASAMSQVCHRFGQELEELGLSVDFVDEAGTSQESQDQLKEQGLKGSQVKSKIDSASACLILESYWRSRP